MLPILKKEEKVKKNYGIITIHTLIFSEFLDAKKPKLVSEESEKNVKNVEKEKAEHLTKPSKQAKRRKKAKAQKNIPAIPAIKELIRPKRLTLLQKVLFYFKI